MSTQPSPANTAVEREKVYLWILELTNPETRENALLELSKKREVVPDLAPMLWNSFGTIAALLQEIINIYPAINPPTLTAHQSNRVCNALALLQCVASHPETRSQFLLAHVPLFLYPFLHTSSKTRPFEYLRLTSLGVIGALVKTDEQEVITFLLTTEIIPLCLRIMESGSELSKTVATFILQKILLDDSGLSYICQTYDRFSHVAMILGKMVISLAKEPSSRLLKHVVRCYLRLSDNHRAREALRQCLPDQLRDNTFTVSLQEDKSTNHWLSQLLKNLESTAGMDPRQVPDYSAVRENFDPYAEEYIPHKVSEPPMDELIEEDVHEEDSWQSLQASSRSSSTQSRRNYYYENYLIVYTYLSKAIDAMVDTLETMREITPCVSKDFDRVLVCEDIQLPLETTETGIHEHVQWQQEGEQEIEYKRDSEDEDYYKYLLNMNLYENENVQSYLLEGNKSIPPNIEAEITREAAQKTAKEVIDIMLEAIPSRSHHTLYSAGAQTSFESFDVNKDLKHLTSMRQSLDLSEMEQYILDNKESYDMFYFMDSCGE